ncbi:MAG: hypothetical protein LJE63_07680 [Desulfobacteraceae bacterium]|jgi:hypothetical protein|nr:hypothetical protein [Desulfobacteraceae bacterium]
MHDHHHHDHDPHDHHHHPHHHAAEQPALSFQEKFLKLLEHWLQHNADHAAGYRDWADRARENGLPDAAALLEEAAAMTLEINRKFEAAAKAAKN